MCDNAELTFALNSVKEHDSTELLRLPGTWTKSLRPQLRKGRGRAKQIYAALRSLSARPLAKTFGVASV